MKKFFLGLCLLAATLVLRAADAPVVNVVPYPSSVTMGEGVYDLHQLKAIEIYPFENAIVAPAGAPEGTSLLTLAEGLIADLRRTAGIDIHIKTTSTTEWVGAAFVVDKELGAEAYRLTIDATGIMLKAADYGGFFNGLQTLRQLMPAAIFGQEAAPEATWTIPCLVIEDAPAMSHRGFHLDISRHFFNKAEVQKLLDMASVYKLNRFHWHLTDDQGWRVEIPEYPNLTTVGAVRKASLTVSDASGDRFFDDTEYGEGCYYTLDDLREVVAYAAERNIQIIPEIDMPGHMTACIVAYPELGCNPERKIEVMTEGGVSRDILNVGKSSTIDFLKCVLGHLAQVFPYDLMHLGGDECPTTAWETNLDCQRLMQVEGLSGVQEIQAWLVEKLGSYLRDNYGKTVVVWDELLANWNNAYTVKPVVMSWRGVDYARQAANRGLYSIMVPTSPLYFDYLQVSRDQLELDCPYDAPYGTINTLEKVYNFDPRSAVSGREQYVLGTQANLWTESCTSLREAEYQYYPRLLALSEIAWLPTALKNFENFHQRLQHQAAVLDAKDIAYAPHGFEPAELTPLEAAIAEAEDILAGSTPGAVGYPSAEVAEGLRTALESAKSGEGNINAKLLALKAKLNAYKAAPIILPTAGRLYKVVSASTYYRYRFNGSSLYTLTPTPDDSRMLAIHYTQQTEPEELWEFLPQDDGTFQMVSFVKGQGLVLPASNGAVATTAALPATNLTIRKATKIAGDITYVPGVVNIKNGDCNLYARLSGRELTLTASTDSTLCYPGTWRIVEVTDYREWLTRLVAKAEKVVARPESREQYGQEALDYLTTHVILAGDACLDQAEVSLQDYIDIAACYAQFLTMRPSVLELIDEGYYYLIHNLANSNYYARSKAGSVQPASLSADAAFRWAFVKNADGTVYLYNKATATAAYVDSNAEGQRVRVGSAYPWQLREVTTEQGKTGIGILDPSDTFSWSGNPKSSMYVVLKPYEHNACIWEFVKTDEEVPTGIEAPHVVPVTLDDEPLYDLSGRPAPRSPHSLHRGIYITHGKKILVQ